MAILFLEDAPKVDDFTPLAVHQAQTPLTFFGAKPVLYEHFYSLTLSMEAWQLEEDPVFKNFSSTSDNDGKDVLLKDVSIWVTSANFIFFQSSPIPTGVAVPYPEIPIFAIMKYKPTVEAIYMNITINDVSDPYAEEGLDTLTLTVLPPSYASNPDTACIKDIYTAMNICSEMNPDPDDDQVDPMYPMAGWITAENMDEYLDQDDNFTGTVNGSENLGPGAGTVRPRDDGDDNSDDNGVNGVNGHEEKYHRTQ